MNLGLNNRWDNHPKMDRCPTNPKLAKHPIINKVAALDKVVHKVALVG